jgi:replicative DNA helicase
MALLELCLEAGADTVIIDSLKDVALGLAKDDVGAGYNQARQNALANGIQVLELHHNVKRIEGAPTHADIYGSTWLPSGAGSAVILDGKPGDPVVKFWHVKQPVNDLGPRELIHDQETGISAFAAKTDLVAMCRVKALSAREAASVMFDTEKPTAAEKKKAERQLEAACRAGLIVSIPSITPNQPTMYAAPSIAHKVQQPTEPPADDPLFD